MADNYLREVAVVNNNFDAFTGVRKFFYARFLRIEMVRALESRGPGPGEGARRALARAVVSNFSKINFVKISSEFYF